LSGTQKEENKKLIERKPYTAIHLNPDRMDDEFSLPAFMAGGETLDPSAYGRATLQSLVQFELENYKEEYLTKIKPLLTVFDSVGTHIDEINEYARIYKPDVMFIDQLDKVHITGNYNRTDEKLKDVYVRAREIAKRHECLMWAVSQASYEAEGKSIIDYSMLDNSRTGKAGEADLILGIGRGADNNDLSDPYRCITVSKNKLNGWHGSRHARISIQRGVFESDNDS